MLAASLLLVSLLHVANTTLFTHAHRLANGSLLIHAHPFGPAAEGQLPSSTHTHSEADLAVLDSLSLLFAIALPALAILATGFPFTFHSPTGAIPFRAKHRPTGRAPPAPPYPF